jgi:FixJ family two-component response regulator
MISATPGFVELAKKAGADDCIEKPFSRKDLISTIEKFVHAFD